MGDAGHEHLIHLGASSRFRLYEAPGEPKINLFAYNAHMQGLIFGVHIKLLQIFLCMQSPRSADWSLQIAINNCIFELPNLLFQKEIYLTGQ